jgi:hypothetical protein
MASSPPKHSWIGLIVLLVICFAAAGVGGAVTTPKILGWYATLFWRSLGFKDYCLTMERANQP